MLIRINIFAGILFVLFGNTYNSLATSKKQDKCKIVSVKAAVPDVKKGQELRIDAEFQKTSNWSLKAYRLLAYKFNVPAALEKSNIYKLNTSNKDPNWHSYNILKWKWLSKTQQTNNRLTILLDTKNLYPGDYAVHLFCLFRQKKHKKDLYLSKVFYFSVVK
jgi:hypothetical protein